MYARLKKNDWVKMYIVVKSSHIELMLENRLGNKTAFSCHTEGFLDYEEKEFDYGYVYKLLDEENVWHAY